MLILFTRRSFDAACSLAVSLVPPHNLRVYLRVYCKSIPLLHILRGAKPTRKRFERLILFVQLANFVKRIPLNGNACPVVLAFFIAFQHIIGFSYPVIICHMKPRFNHSRFFTFWTKSIIRVFECTYITVSISAHLVLFVLNARREVPLIFR
jgi:hypothetical protein